MLCIAHSIKVLLSKQTVSELGLFVLTTTFLPSGLLLVSFINKISSVTILIYLVVHGMDY